MRSGIGQLDMGIVYALLSSLSPGRNGVRSRSGKHTFRSAKGPLRDQLQGAGLPQAEHHLAMTEFKGQPPSAEDQFYLEWGLESLRSSIDVVNNVLSQTITISATLLGVTFIFQELLVVPWVKALVCVCWLLALVCSFVGVLPYEGRAVLNSPTAVRDHKGSALRYKLRLLKLAAVLLLIGLLAVIIVVILVVPGAALKAP